jgi:hypothetical protein
LPFFCLIESGYGSNYLGWREGQKANGTAPAVESPELGGTSDAVPSVPVDVVPAVAADVVVPSTGDGSIDFIKE